MERLEAAVPDDGYGKKRGQGLRTVGDAVEDRNQICVKALASSSMATVAPGIRIWQHVVAVRTVICNVITED